VCACCARSFSYLGSVLDFCLSRLVSILISLSGSNRSLYSIILRASAPFYLGLAPVFSSLPSISVLRFHLTTTYNYIKDSAAPWSAFAFCR
jgi:hypothetical protein